MTPIDRSRLPALGPESPFRFPPVERRRLAAGLQVATVEHPGVPVITFMLLVPGGAAEDPPDCPGLAALTGDMLDEGSGDRSAIAVQEALARIGADFGTEVGSDATLLSLTVLTRFAAEGLALLADIAARPRFDAGEYAHVRDLRLHRLQQLRDVAPSLADRAFARALYGPHPYGHLPLGTDAVLRAASLDEVRHLHARVFRPSGATIVAVGDGSHRQIADLVDAAFGAWRDPDDPGPSSAGSPAAAEPDPVERALLVVDRPGAAQSELRLGHLGAPRLTPDYHALIVLNMILGGQFTSRLNLRLREEKGYTYGARTSFDLRRGRGPFVAQAAVQTAVTAEAIADTASEIAAIGGARPPTLEELDLARAALTRGFPRGFETAEQVARAVVQMTLYGLPEDHFDRFVPSVGAVDQDAVMAAAARHLSPDRLLVVVAGDHAAVAPALAGLGRGQPAVVTVG